MCSNSLNTILQDDNKPNISQLELEITIEFEESMFKTNPDKYHRPVITNAAVSLSVNGYAISNS